MSQRPQVARAALSPSRWLALIRRVAGPRRAAARGPTENFIAMEVDGDERDRVIAAFQSCTPKPFSRDFDQRAGAADHPTFRTEPSRQRAGEAREAIRP